MRIRRFCVAVWMALILGGCSSATPEQQIVNDAAGALGGSDALSAVTSIVMDVQGTQYNLGQDLVPGASGQTFSVTGRRAMDLVNRRGRTELTRQPNFTYFQGPAPQRVVTGVDPTVAYNVGANGNATRAPETAAAERRMELLHHPITAVRAGLDPASQLANARTEGAESLVDITTQGGMAFTLAIDNTTKLPTRVISRADNTNLGDVAISTTFANYQESGGLQLPTQLTTKTDDFTTQDIQVQNSVNGDAGNLAVPEAAASAAAPTAPPVTVAEERLAPGIWLLAGGSHHSILVEFNDHLMLMEAPQNDARALAVIAKARELVPGKPLTQLVNSHHHFDHSGGVRAAIAEGLTVITHQGNVAFFEEVARRPHTVVPDALAMNAKPLTIEGVADERTISDGAMTVNLYAVTGEHSQTMLMAYFPQSRILVEADVYSPGGAVQMFAGEFLMNLGPRNLRVDRIAPLHGTVVPYATFVREASAPRPSSD